MSYYIFKSAVATNETGSVCPQIQKMSPNYNYDAENSVHALSKAHKSFPDFIPDLNYFILHNKAKLSDVLSTAMIHRGFLISKKLKNIFEQFTIAEHRFYPATVAYKKQFYEYYWMHIICDMTDEIDYPKSTFFVYYNYAHNLGNIEIDSKEDLINKEFNLKANNPEKTIAIWSKDIFFVPSVKLKLNLFKIGSFDNNYYINTELYHALVNASITGIAITPTTNLHL
jgi:hypothetical protein